jgi:hypothetical protein
MAKYYEKQSKSQNAASLGSTHLAFHNNLLSITLFPQSFTRTDIGVPYGSLAGISGGSTGLPCSTPVTGIG